MELQKTPDRINNPKEQEPTEVSCAQISFYTAA